MRMAVFGMQFLVLCSEGVATNTSRLLLSWMQGICPSSALFHSSSLSTSSSCLKRKCILSNSSSRRESCGGARPRPGRRSRNTMQMLSSSNKSSFTAIAASQQQPPPPPTSPIKTLAGSDIYAAEVIKKSRFIGYASHCPSWKEAQTILDTVRKDHPKSRHVCFGFVSSSSSSPSSVRSGSASSNLHERKDDDDDDDDDEEVVEVGTERCSDDGEPTGTAGMPIVSAIKGEGLSDVLCIVVRYFGGIKLGAGGLIRAYGNTARLVLRSASTILHVPQMSIRLSTMASNSGAIYAAVAKYYGVASEEVYTDLGELVVTITCTEERGERMKQDIVDATRGGVTFY
jgi:putative IMPACT (imprinted ancient) family translation regulator